VHSLRAARSLYKVPEFSRTTSSSETALISQSAATELATTSLTVIIIIMIKFLNLKININNNNNKSFIIYNIKY
jgi:hypothetical protein